MRVPPVSTPLPQFYYDKPNTRGGSPEARAEMDAILRVHAQQQAAEPSAQRRALREAELLTSRLADREMQIGDSIPLQGGTFKVAKTFVGSGAYFTLLCDEARVLPPKLVCRGTSMRRSATQGLLSGLSNLSFTMGSLGVHAHWNALHTYLKENDIHALQLLGKSQGGCSAQQLAVLLECSGIEVTALTTVCSVGVGPELTCIFNERVLHDRPKPFRLVVIRNGGLPDGSDVDYVPAIGGVHLGFGAPSHACDTEVYTMAPGTVPPTAMHAHGWWALAAAFLGSFAGGHIRQTTLGEFNYTVTAQGPELQAKLAEGNRLNSAHRIVAAIAHVFSLGRLNPIPLRSLLGPAS